MLSGQLLSLAFEYTTRRVRTVSATCIILGNSETAETPAQHPVAYLQTSLVLCCFERVLDPGRIESLPVTNSHEILHCRRSCARTQHATRFTVRPCLSSNPSCVAPGLYPQPASGRPSFSPDASCYQVYHSSPHPFHFSSLVFTAMLAALPHNCQTPCRHHEVQQALLIAGSVP